MCFHIYIDHISKISSHPYFGRCFIMIIITITHRAPVIHVIFISFSICHLSCFLQQLDDLDYKHYWSPQVVVANIDGDLDEDVTWTRVKEREAGYRDPVIYQRRKMRGKFKENLELKHFPVDVQVRRSGNRICYPNSRHMSFF